MKRRTRLLLYRAGLVALSTTLTALLLELGLRVAGYEKMGELSGGRHRFLRTSSHPDLAYELVPGARGRAWGFPVSINSLGFRDREVTARPRPGTHRIVVLGDSITFAEELDVEHRFTELLQARFEAEGQPVEVLNLGVGGYDTLNEVAFFEQTGVALDPDLVVVAFCINDLGVHSTNLLMVQLLERHGAIIRRSRLAQLLAFGLDRVSLRVNFEALNRDDVFRETYASRILPVDDDRKLRPLMRSLRRDLESAPDRRRTEFLRWYTSAAKVGRFRYALERLRRLSREAGFRVLVTIVPYLREGEQFAAFEIVYKIVRHEARRVGFEVLNLHQPFRSYGLFRLRPGDGGILHPNAEGHRLMARELFERLRTRFRDAEPEPEQDAATRAAAPR